MDKWLYTMVKTALTLASPELVEAIRVNVKMMVDAAKKTANPWDDALAGFLQMVVGKPTVKG